MPRKVTAGQPATAGADGVPGRGLHGRGLAGVISTVTDAVLAEVTEWQTRPLEPMYPVVFFDALRVRIQVDLARAAQHHARLVQGGAPLESRAPPIRDRV